MGLHLHDVPVPRVGFLVRELRLSFEKFSYFLSFGLIGDRAHIAQTKHKRIRSYPRITSVKCGRVKCVCEHYVVLQ